MFLRHSVTEWMNRGWPQSLARNAPAAVKSSKGSQAHSTSIFMSYLHLHDLYTTLSEKLYSLPDKQTRTITQAWFVWTAAPTPHLSKSGQRWPLSGSLSQYALRYETGKHMCPLCVGLQPCGTSLRCTIIFTHCRIDGDQKSVIWMKREWWTDRCWRVKNTLDVKKWNTRTEGEV